MRRVDQEDGAKMYHQCNFSAFYASGSRPGCAVIPSPDRFGEYPQLLGLGRTRVQELILPHQDHRPSSQSSSKRLSFIVDEDPRHDLSISCERV